MRRAWRCELYGGIRPYEVRRLTWGDVDWEEGEVRIRPRQSKTGGGRQVPLSRSVLAWLRSYYPQGRGSRFSSVRQIGTGGGALCARQRVFRHGVRTSCGIPLRRIMRKMFTIGGVCRRRWGIGTGRCCRRAMCIRRGFEDARCEHFGNWRREKGRKKALTRPCTAHS